MKVVFLASRFYPAIGGVEKHSFEVAKNLVGRGISVTVITEGDLEHTKITSGIKVLYRDFGSAGFAKKFRIWRDMLRLLNVFRKADVIHCHDVFIWYLPIRLLLPFQRVYTTFHGYETQVPPSTKSRIIRKVSEILSKGNIIIGEYIQKWYNTRADVILYGGVDTKGIIEEKKRKNSGISIALIGRLEKDIGIETYVQVFQKLQLAKTNFTLDIFGDGALRKKLDPFGTTHGFVSDIGRIVGRYDVIFASSYLTILEALEREKFVVAVYENELKRDYLKMSKLAQFILIDNDSNRIVQAIQQAEKKGLKINNRKALREFLKHNTWDHITQHYINLWQKRK